MQFFPISLSRRQNYWVPFISFVAGVAVIGGPALLRSSNAQKEILFLKHDLDFYQTELKLAQTELATIKPELARHIIREQARHEHTARMRQGWVNTFGYESAIQVKTPEQIAFPNQDVNQMVEELVRLSTKSEKPMNELVHQVIEKNN